MSNISRVDIQMYVSTTHTHDTATLSGKILFFT